VAYYTIVVCNRKNARATDDRKNEKRRRLARGKRRLDATLLNRYVRLQRRRISRPPAPRKEKKTIVANGVCVCARGPAGRGRI